MTSKDSLFSVYIIINEWSETVGGPDFQEIIDGKWFESESEAWDHLSIIAESMNLILEREDTSFNTPDAHEYSLAYDTYYIQELTR